MEMTKDYVIKELENAHYEDFLDEDQRKFVMTFNVPNSEIPIIIYNSVGGHIEGYFRLTPEMLKTDIQTYMQTHIADVELSRGFLAIAIPYLQEELKKRKTK